MSKTLTSTFAVAAVLIAAPAQAEPFRVDCVGIPPFMLPNNQLPPNEGSDEMHLTGKIDTQRGGYIIQSVTGTGIVRLGWSPFTSFGEHGPFSKIEWRGADGLDRYYGIQIRPKGAELWVGGYTIRNGRKVMEYYKGKCAIVEE